MLLDPETFALVQRADTVLEADSDGEFTARTTCEIFQSEIEGQTPICATVDEAAIELRRLRGHLEALVGEQGLVLASAGTHPFGRYEDQVLTDRTRYRGIVEQVQYPARRELVFGLHIHVGVADPETAIQVVRALRLHIPGADCALGKLALLARSAERAALNAAQRLRYPSALGPAACLRGLGRVRHLRGSARARGRARGLHPHLVGCAASSPVWHRRGARDGRRRACRGRDRPRRLRASVGEAGCRSAHFRRRAHSRAHSCARTIGRQSAMAWRRPSSAPTQSPTPIRSQILRTLDALGEGAGELESEAALLGIERIVRAGTGAERQLAVFAATADIRAVTRMIAVETREAAALA